MDSTERGVIGAEQRVNQFGQTNLLGECLNQEKANELFLNITK